MHAKPSSGLQSTNTRTSQATGPLGNRRDPPAIPIQRMTPAEMHEKWDKGLCFSCDKRWSVNHRCKKTMLLCF